MGVRPTHDVKGFAKLRDHLLRGWASTLIFFPGSDGIARRPDPGCRSNSTQSSPLSVMRCCTSKLERRKLHDLGFDHDVVAELGRLEGRRALVSTIG